jgi:tungstate transport system ATP-binding protein
MPGLDDGRALLSLRGVRVIRSSQTILDVPFLDVYPGELLSVAGRNGAGKSTLLQVMGLLLVPDQGEVRFHDVPISARRNPVAARRRMAMVFQEPLLFDTDVFSNVACGLRLRGTPRSEVQPRVHFWLQRLGIDDLARRAARTLSGGEARRVSLARALVLEPELLLLDEPFAALDYFTREALMVELPGFLQVGRTTAVLVTHDPREADQLSSRSITLKAGQIVTDCVTTDGMAPVGVASDSE